MMSMVDQLKNKAPSSMNQWNPLTDDIKFSPLVLPAFNELLVTKLDLLPNRRVGPWRYKVHGPSN